MEPMVTGSSSPHDDSPTKTTPSESGAARHASVKPYSALDDIPGLPPFDPGTVDIEPSGFDLIWDLVRGIFGRRPHDRAA